MPSLFHVGLSDQNADQNVLQPGRILPPETGFGRPPSPARAQAAGLYHAAMADELDVDALVLRFQERARAVRQRAMPPIEGAERQRFLDQARIDYMDYAMIGDATATLADGVLTLTVDLRPRTS